MVVHLWRYPVKSCGGEQRGDLEVVPDGIDGDRAWGVRSTETGRILTGRQVPELLMASVRVAGGVPELTLPDGSTLVGCGAATDAALSAWLGRGVELVEAAGAPRGRSQAFVEAVDEDGESFEWELPEGRFVDLLPLLVVTTASLDAGRALHPDGDWDVRRFRPNLVVHADGDGFVEDAWAGRAVRIGEVELDAVAPCSRCTMVIRPQPGGIDRDPDIYRTLAAHHGGTLGMWCSVRTPGTIRVGDEVVVD